MTLPDTDTIVIGERGACPEFYRLLHEVHQYNMRDDWDALNRHIDNCEICTKFIREDTFDDDQIS